MVRRRRDNMGRLPRFSPSLGNQAIEVHHRRNHPKDKDKDKDRDREDMVIDRRIKFYSNPIFLSILLLSKHLLAQIIFSLRNHPD
jgi:hypothetical protein